MRKLILAMLLSVVATSLYAFEISDINQGEETSYEIEVQNLGTQSVKVNSKIEVYKTNSSEILITETIPEKNVS